MNLIRSQKGQGLIEVLIAIAILGVVAVAFLTALATASKAIILADELTTAESLARSELEYVKSQEYCSDAWSYTVTSSDRSSSNMPCWWDADNPPLLSSDYAGYSVDVKAEDFDADGDSIIEIPGDDENIRKITVSVYHQGRLILTTSDYKVNR